MSEDKKKQGNIILKALIAVLIVVLYYIITSPWDEKLRVDALKQQSRVNMGHIRTAELMYLSENNTYAPTLKDLISWIKATPSIEQKQDSLFNLKGASLNLDSVIYSPVNKEIYKYQVSDTSAVKRYFLECPGGSGSIGSMIDDDKVNKSTWE